MFLQAAIVLSYAWNWLSDYMMEIGSLSRKISCFFTPKRAVEFEEQERKTTCCVGGCKKMLSLYSQYQKQNTSVRD